MAKNIRLQFDQQPSLFDPEPKNLNRPEKIGSAKVIYQTTSDILTRASGFMDAYKYTLNPYSGCSFGCTYCYAAFFATSQEERDQWGYWVKVKENAVQSLLRRPPGRLDGDLIYMSSVTDPYQPIERKLGLTQSLLQILAEHHKPKLVIQTRSPDVVRDIELFKKIISKGGRIQVNMTVTTDDEDVRRTFEPFCPSNKQRLDTISEITNCNIDACVTMTPLIWVTDAEQFADDLIKTGVKKFIAQPFHTTRGKFVAGTRDAARQKMAEKLNCSIESFPQEYGKHYRRVFGVLQNRLRGHGSLGVGKDGFAPPF